MLKNYINIAWRNLWKNKVFSLINIFGLSIGIAFTLLTGAYLWGELSVNRDLKNAGDQYILQSKWKDPNMGPEITTIAQLPKALKDRYPGLVANYYHWDAVTSNISQGDKHFRENIQVGDSTFLSMFGFTLLHGDAKTAFAEPFNTVITQRMAIKYFGTTDVVGQTLSIESFLGTKHDFVISGVLNNIPKNSVTNLNDSNNIDVFLPAKADQFLGRNMDGWTNNVMIGYIQLQKGISPKDLDGPIRHLIKENAPKQTVDNLTPYLAPLSSYYADHVIGKQILYTLGIAALFILLMAVINFINICIGRSSARMKEMGIRKVLGGLRKQLIWQFLIESVLLTVLATMIALGLYALARPYFSDVLGEDIASLFSFPVYYWFIPLFFALFVGLVAGLYPALVLSGLKSVDSIKGKLNQVKESIFFRKALVAFQFAIATMILIGAIIVSKQVDLFFSKDLGFNKDMLVYAQVPRDWSLKGVQHMEAVRYQLSQMPEVKSVSLSYEVPDQNGGGGSLMYRHGADPKNAIVTEALNDDNQYAATYSIPLKAGAFFTPNYTQADSTKIVINQTAATALGWTDPKDAIGQQVNIQGIVTPCTIYGVTSNFHFGSMQQKIGPMVFINVNFSTGYRYLSVKLKPGNIQTSIADLQKHWRAVMPDAPFEYHFVDDALNKLYKTEIQLKKASLIATVLTVVIVLLGVLGLISLSIQKRVKEIGIRKVLGSSVSAIVGLFIKEFLAIVLMAGVLACPLAWLVMHNWLDGYVYRITLNLYPFVLSLALLTLFTAVLIGLQTVKAALATPVKSLRSE